MNRAWEDAVRILTIFRPGVKVRCGSVLSLYVQVLLVLVQLLSCVWLSLTISRSFPKFMSIESVIPSRHFILCHPFILLPSIFPSIRIFSNESVVRNSSRDSQESSSTPQFKSINFGGLRLLYGPTLTSIHDYWKDHSLDYMDLCWQSDIFAF